jgi:hypothetical protein
MEKKHPQTPMLWCTVTGITVHNRNKEAVHKAAKKNTTKQRMSGEEPEDDEQNTSDG